MSPEWIKSFGFKEFDAQLLKKEHSEGCNDARLKWLFNRREVALALCPHSGSSQKDFMEPMGAQTTTLSLGDTSLASTKTLDNLRTSLPGWGKMGQDVPTPNVRSISKPFAGLAEDAIHLLSNNEEIPDN